MEKRESETRRSVRLCLWLLGLETFERRCRNMLFVLEPNEGVDIYKYIIIIKTYVYWKAEVEICDMWYVHVLDTGSTKPINCNPTSIRTVNILYMGCQSVDSYSKILWSYLRIWTCLTRTGLLHFRTCTSWILVLVTELELLTRFFWYQLNPCKLISIKTLRIFLPVLYCALPSTLRIFLRQGIFLSQGVCVPARCLRACVLIGAGFLSLTAIKKEKKKEVAHSLNHSFYVSRCPAQDVTALRTGFRSTSVCAPWNVCSLGFAGLDV